MCASRVSTCNCSVWYRDLDVQGTSRIVWLHLYESLLTYVAHMDLVGDPVQGTCYACASEILITKVRKIST
jgi:hypothetical protein